MANEGLRETTKFMKNKLKCILNLICTERKRYV